MRERKGGFEPQWYRGEGPRKLEAGTTVMWPPEPGTRPEWKSPEGTNAAHIFWTPGLQKCETGHFYSFKPPGLWEFDTAASGNEYNLLEASSSILQLWQSKLPPRTSLGGLAVETLPSNARSACLIPGQGAKIPHTSWPKKKKKNHKKQKQYLWQIQ